jgi:hypothetical protein
MRIDLNGGALYVICRGVPRFPAHLEAKAEAAQLAGPDEAKAFLTWWIEALRVRKYRHGATPSGEEWVQARRLLARYEPARLRKLAAHFLATYAAEQEHYPFLLRLFVHYLPNVEDDLG